jgi:hypothetical protein
MNNNRSQNEMKGCTMRAQWFVKFAAHVGRSAVVFAGLALVLLGASGTAWAGGPPPPGTPEVDPGAMGSALALLAGGVLVLTDRLRRK